MVCKIKLVFTPIFDALRMDMPSLGMATLTSYLRNKGYVVSQEDLLARVRFHNSNAETKKLPKIDLGIDNYKEYIEYILFDKKSDKIDSFVNKLVSLEDYQEYSVIGFSVHSVYQFIFALLIAKRIKKELDKPIVFGGTFITLSGHLFFDNFSFIDYMIVGGGEVPMDLLIQYILFQNIDLSKIPNLMYKKGYAVQVDKKIRLDIGDIPIPDFDGLNLQHYSSNIKGGYSFILPYQLKKGCNNRCSFCTHYLFGNGLEVKNADKVVSEIKRLKAKYKTDYFYFCDSTFNTDYEYTKDICSNIIRSKLDIKWGGLGRANNVTSGLFRLIKKSGCVFLRYGIESGCSSLVKNIGKRFTSDDASRALKLSAKNGVINLVSLIAGYPHETEESHNETIEFIKKNRSYIYSGRCFMLFVEPQSEIAKNPEKYGITNLKFLLKSFFDGTADYEYFNSSLNSFRTMYSFDEIGGLKWADKLKQQYERSKVINNWINHLLNKDNRPRFGFEKYFVYFNEDYTQKKLRN